MSQTLQYKDYDGSAESSAEDRLLHGGCLGFAIPSSTKDPKWIALNPTFAPPWTSISSSARRLARLVISPSADRGGKKEQVRR